MRKVVTKEVELCDRCGEDFDTTINKIKWFCPVCRREVCSNCKAGLMEQYPTVCRDCNELPEIRKRKKDFDEAYYKMYNDEKTYLFENVSNPNILTKEKPPTSKLQGE